MNTLKNKYRLMLGGILLEITAPPTSARRVVEKLLGMSFSSPEVELLLADVQPIRCA